MKISIVVPVYNAEKYLEECIISVLNQTDSDWELVLVDDGSTDKSGDICDAFSKQYPEKIYSFHKANEGQFLTRQFGISKCTGDYTGFLDADDLLDKDFVEIINEAIKEENLLDVVCFNFARFDENNCKKYSDVNLALFTTETEMKTLYEKIVTGEITGSMCTKVFKTDLLKNTLIDKTTVSRKKFGEDAFHSFSMIFNAKSVKFIEDVLYYYRDNPSGASMGYGERSLDYFSIKYIFELIEDFLFDKYPDDEHLFEQLYAHNFNNTVNHILKYYRHAGSYDRKKNILKYDWNSYLLEKTLSVIENNKYVRPSYKKVWKAFSNKNYTEIYLRERFKKLIGW